MTEWQFWALAFFLVLCALTSVVLSTGRLFNWI